MGVATVLPNLPDLPLTDADWLFALLMGLILLVPLVAERVRLPAIVGLVLAGAAIGPGGLGLVVREGAVGTIGTVGLLYLMFLAGLELDLEEFSSHRHDSIVFGTLTFLIPFGLGLASSFALGFDPLASALIASCWASHTLLTYPVFRRHGTVASRVVATSVGGTILTDTAALVVLVIVAGVAQGTLDATFWGLLTTGMAVLLAVTLGILPRVGRWFFATFAHDAGVRFAFVLATLFGASALAHLVGLEPIIGAFLAGLGLNRLVPNGSRLMERTEFVGANLLVPIFLISVGLLIDFRLLADPRTLLMAVVFTAVAISAKALAALGAGRWLGYDRTEIGAMFALSNAQAAATLAAVVVGLRIGLFDTEVVNAVVMVILVTCLLSSWVAGRIAPRLVRPAPRRALGTMIVLPVVRPESAAPLARLAGALAHADGGVVVPLTIVVGEPGTAALEQMRAVNARAEQMARSHGVETEGIVRIDSSPATGISNTVRERDASLVLLGWQGPDHGAMFTPTSVNPLVAEAAAPVLLARLDDRTPKRVVVVIPHADSTTGGGDNLRLALETARRVGALHRCPVAAISCTSDPTVLATVTSALGAPPVVEARTAAAVVRASLGDDDLLVVPVRAEDTALRGAERLNRAAAGSQVIAAVGGAPAAPASRSGRRRRAEMPLSPLR
jgi:Kef-type K+ transport system membrane component KefB